MRMRIFQIMAFGCIALAARCQDDPIIKIEFISLARGYLKQVSISRDSLVEVINSGEAGNQVIKKKLTADEWKKFATVLSDVSLDEIPELKSPTSRRAFDGAKHSSIVISTRAGKSYTHSFDDEDPHKKLQPLMEAINEVIDREKRKK
jgi:hypothetical protein